MPTVRKSVIVPASCERMFELVDGVESYPEFLPWCSSAEVYERTGEVTRARFDVDYRGLKTRVATRNRKRAPHTMELELVEGPFERFSGAWRFQALGPGGCRVELALDYTFSSRALEKILGPVFEYIAATLVDSFVARAESLGGSRVA